MKRPLFWKTRSPRNPNTSTLYSLLLIVRGVDHSIQPNVKRSSIPIALIERRERITIRHFEQHWHESSHRPGSSIG